MESTKQFPKQSQSGIDQGKFPTAGSSSSKRRRQPYSKGMKSQSNWARRPTANVHGVPQKKGRASLSLSLEKTLSNPFFPTDVTSKCKARPWRPQIGLLRQQNGNSTHGMRPSWATCKLSDMSLQDKVPANGPNWPFFQRLQSRLPGWHTDTRQIPG